MTDQELLNRISTRPTVMVGKPVIKGTRLTVEYILNILAHGAIGVEILDEYEGLVEADLQACLLFASTIAIHSDKTPHPSHIPATHKASGLSH
jgi:uncharacterized protein (DUF433 family)